MVESGIKSLRDNWIILAFIVSLIVTWTQFQSRISSLEARVTKAESQIEETYRTVSNIDNRLVDIKTTLDFIKNQVNK